MGGTRLRSPHSSVSHLEGDALNVALLVLEAQRTMRIGLVSALTDHYGSPGRWADYWRRIGLVSALTDHYGPPGRWADYWRRLSGWLVH